MRSLSEIYDAIALEKANMAELNDWFIHKSNPESKLDDHQTLLEDLTTTSKVAIWRLWMWIVAVAIWIHEGLWDAFKAEVDEILSVEKAHTLPWYKASCLYFQYGDQLSWDDGYGYATIDLNKRIVKHAAAIEADGIVRLKVAAEDASGNIIPLTTGQITAFKNFWAKWKDAGVILDIISISPDLLHLAYDIVYDPAVMKSDGSLINDGSFPVQEAIKNYINNLTFNGKFSLEGCDAAVRSATGVIDFTRTLAQSKSANSNYNDISVSVTAYAGFFQIDPNYLLDNTLTYHV